MKVNGMMIKKMDLVFLYKSNGEKFINIWDNNELIFEKNYKNLF